LDVLDVIARYPNLCNYIDIPLQHISDRILQSMRRGVTGDEMSRLLDTIRERIPGVAIRTTFITGYPGETEKEYRELQRFIEKSRFDRMGVFTYSAEEDTAASALKDSVYQSVKLRRAEELMALQEGISLQLNQKKTGSVVKVIIDRVEGDFYIARTEFDSPEVDNEVLISKGKRILEPGAFYDVRITKAESFDLYAELI